MKKIILIFGSGYVSKFLSKELSENGWNVYCTSRNPQDNKYSEYNVKIINFLDNNVEQLIKSANAILSTVPTDNQSIDPVLEKYSRIISQEKFEWVGYLSSTGVYGNYDGEWVDEQTICKPSNRKTELRLLAEQKWLELHFKYRIPTHILRLSGIYGPGRNCLEEINKGKDFTIIKKDHYFSRIHIEDICQVIISSINNPTPGEIYNVSDNEPAPLNIVHQFAAHILNKEPLKQVLFADAVLSEQAKMFFNDNKKVSNKKIIRKLNFILKYPNYRIGLLNGCLPYL